MKPGIRAPISAFMLLCNVGQARAQPVQPGDDAIQTVDPTSAFAAPGPLPSVSRPSLELFGAALALSADGAKATLTVAPYSLLDSSYKFLLSEARLELRSGFGDDLAYGASLSTGYSTASELSAEELNALATESSAACPSPSDEKMLDTIEQLKGFLQGALPGTCLEDPALVPSHRGGALITCWREHREEAAEEMRSSGDAFGKAFTDASTALQKTKDACFLKELRKRRLEKSFQNAFGFYVQLGADGFPSVDGPDIVSDNETPDIVSDDTRREPVPHAFQGYQLSGSLAYFPCRQFGLWITGSREQRRAKSTIEELSTRHGLTIEAAYNHPLSDTFEEDGFLPSIALGLSMKYVSCAESAGCPEKILGYADPLPFDEIFSGSPFVDFRISSKLQVRATLPITYYQLAADQDGASHVLTVIPTLSTAVTKWTVD